MAVFAAPVIVIAASGRVQVVVLVSMNFFSLVTVDHSQDPYKYVN